MPYATSGTRPGGRRPRRGSRLALSVLALALAPPAGAQEPGPGGTAFALDRWLVSAAFPAARAEEGSPLSAPGPEGVLPDRGREAAGVEWSLVRLDGSTTFRLDSLTAGRDGPDAGGTGAEGAVAGGAALVFAHAYLRSPDDRTLRLAWSGVDGTRVRAWLNGRPLLGLDGEPLEAGDEDPVRVRLGAGWNTVLLRAIGGGGDLGFAARLLPDEATGGSGVQGLRVQASRPPGEVRTGPEPWILVEPAARATGHLAWRGDVLLGGLSVDATAWSPTPVDLVRFKLRAGGAEAEGAARWLTPGAPVRTELWLPLDRLRRAAESGHALETEIGWAKRQERRLLVPPREVPASREEPIRLVGWTVRESPASSPAGRLGPSDAPPASAGWSLAGEWRVPGPLAGRSLSIDVEGAPGEYRIGERTLPPGHRTATLCAPCERGQRIRVLVRSSADWSRFPAAIRADGDARDGVEAR
jgi:hypothetical protein